MRNPHRSNRRLPVMGLEPSWKPLKDPVRLSMRCRGLCTRLGIAGASLHRSDRSRHTDFRWRVDGPRFEPGQGL